VNPLCEAPCLTSGSNVPCRVEGCLIRAAVSGNPDARGEVFGRLYPAVLRQAHGICRVPSDAEDVAQSAMLHVVQRLHGIRDCRRLLPWVRVIVLNTHRMSVRRSRFAPSAEKCVWDVDSLAAPPTDPIDRLRAKRDLATVLGAIGRLSPRLRETFQARVVAGQSTAETARALGITAAAVRTRLKRARQALLAALLERGSDHQPAAVPELSPQHVADELACLLHFGQGQRAVNLLPFPARGHHAGAFQDRQVLRNVR
jgi:RNA polymerase sigma factor CnrH